MGSNHNVNPARLMGIINEGLKSRNAVIGRIEVMKKFSFFEIEETKKNQIIKALNGMIVSGTKLSVEVAKEKPVVESSTNKSRVSQSKTRDRKEDWHHNKNKRGRDKRRKYKN